ncbi:C6 finger domain-containing protein [Seiridium cupressi]
MEAAPFSAANYFPQRRRAAQACAACSKRKTRCDAVKPKCSWCRTHDLDCVYLDSQQPRIDANTSVLLERIQLLEDRLFSTPLFTGLVGTLGSPASSLTASGPAVPAEVASAAVASLDASDLNAQIPASHTANANYVYEWPIVRQLLSQSQEEYSPALLFAGHHGKTTDVFFQSSESPRCLGPPPESWRLFRDGTLPASTDSVGLYQTLLCLYFEEAQMFFPLLSFRDLSAVLEEVVATEHPDESRDSSISASQYCLLLLVLALASLVASGKTLIRLDRVVHHHGKEAEVQMHLSLSVQLWGKAALLLGYVSTQSSLEAAQCSMLASLYHGASGRVSESFHWAHVTATKCEIIARSTILNSKSPVEFADPFRRLYWISFIWEGDFMSELSVNLPSGIARLAPIPSIASNMVSNWL